MNASDSSKPAPVLWRLDTWFPTLEPSLRQSLQRFHAELLRFNGKVNLVSVATEREADETHFADSVLAGQAFLNSESTRVIYDIGSGNGMPGLVIALLDPSRELHLVESDVRKGEFLKHMAAYLNLTNVRVHASRFENLPTGSVQVGVARGFASMSKACLLGNKVFALGGRFYHLKSNSWGNEILEFPPQVMSAWAPELIAEYKLPASQAARALVRTLKRT